MKSKLLGSSPPELNSSGGSVGNLSLRMTYIDATLYTT